MYKDKDKQKEANRIAAQKRRNKAKGMTQGMTAQPESEGMTRKLPEDSNTLENNASLSACQPPIAGKGIPNYGRQA